MSRPRILVLSFSDISSDARVLKQVRLLSELYEVDSCGYGPKPGGVSQHFEIPSELAVWRYDRGAVILHLFRRAYWSNAAIMAARDALTAGTWDVVVANDVDSVGLAISLNPRFGVHADLHEYAPRQKEDVWRWRLFVAPFVRWMCRSFVRQAASVTTVGQGIADEYRRKFSIDAQVVTNAAPYVELAPTGVADRIRLVHSGACLRDRNILAIVRAVELTNAHVTLSLYLTPNDPAFLGELVRRAEQSDRITVYDPVPYDQLPATLNDHDVGVHILPPVNFNNSWALPNKFFDYVQARLGVIIGPSPEMERILHNGKFGAVTADFSAEALSRTLDSLDVETVRTWKAAANAAARELSSDKQIAVWGAAIEQLLEGASG